MRCVGIPSRWFMAKTNESLTTSFIHLKKLSICQMPRAIWQYSNPVLGYRNKAINMILNS